MVLTTRQKIYLPFKRLFDVIFSLLLIILLSPLFIILGIIVWIDTKAFPLFRQRRVGKNKKLFLIWKFRTMHKNTPKDVPTHLLDDPNKYITKFGKFLRKSSLDELPQLLNILFGQMSFVGPRPALWNQEDLIESRDVKGVNSIRPGLTGWAQINGRDNVTIEEKTELDEHYLKHFNIWTDIKIMFLTFFKVVSRENVQEGKQS